MKTVRLYPAKTKGKIKPLHGVGGGPLTGHFENDATEEFIAAGIPYSRLHDIEWPFGSGEFVDIHCIFPDFDKDENDPSSYNFVLTDEYLKAIIAAGTKPFYRLGNSIEQWPIKRYIHPPKDFRKWGRICSHIVSHYNDGWADGFHMGIEYWEIWNEPELKDQNFTGTDEEMLSLYDTAARILKADHPDIKVGGLATCSPFTPMAETLLKMAAEDGTPLDFFSWHGYSRWPSHTQSLCKMWRGELDKRGFQKVESIYNEWNYVKGWGDDWVYSLRAESGDLNLKGAAFIAGVMIDCQNAPVDMIMFYDARANCGMNNLFDKTTLWPTKGYYPYLAWAKLLDLGTQVPCRITEGLQEDVKAATGVVDESKKDKVVPGGFTAVAAKAKKGKGGAVFVCRYSDDDNASEVGLLSIRVPGVDLAKAKARCHVTDLIRSNTEVPLMFQPDGSAQLKAFPLSFALIEW